MTPSWADEVITKIADRFQNVKLLNTKNITVQATLKTLREYSELKVLEEENKEEFSDFDKK